MKKRRRDRGTETQREKETDRQRDRGIARQRGKETERLIDREASDRCTDR